MTTYELTVRRRHDGWTITHVSHAILTTTVEVDDPADIRNVLADAEDMASWPVLWRANACGFDAVLDLTAG